ncbi:MAG: serine/threonine-protein kinase [Puniceicoccaceae bacterium]
MNKESEQEDLNLRFEEIYEAANRMDPETMEFMSPAFAKLQKCANRYRIEEQLGQGALKKVFRTYDELSQRWVALARLREERGLRFFDPFIYEAWLISSLSHPNIIKVYDVGIDPEGRPFFTMDLKGETTLADVLRKSADMSLLERLEIMLKVCDAVAYAHSKGILHLDLKPENIQSDAFGEVLVCDWGLGKRLESDAESYDSLVPGEPDVASGTGKGSPGYMAPEQVLPDGDISQRTDVYALGCILHVMLCGKPPHTGSREEVLTATVESDISGLRSVNPDRSIPASLEAVVLKAISRNPDNRYSSVTDFRRDIENFISGYSTVAEHPGFLRELGLFIKRNRLPVSIIGVSLLVVSVLSGIFLDRLDRQQLATQEERDRADHLMSEVNLITSEYDDLFESQELSRKDLANQLAISARSLKNIAAVEQPIQTVQEVTRVAGMALELDPHNEIAYQQMYWAYCVSLNFSAISTDTRMAEQEFRISYTRLAEAFTDFKYGKSKRPSVEEMVSFINEAWLVTPRIKGFLDAVFSYHAAVVGYREGFDREFRAILAFCNGGNDNLAMEYDWEVASMSIRTRDPDIPLTIGVGNTGSRSLLRYLPVQSLKLESAGLFDFNGMDGLAIEVLDLSGCSNLVLEETLSLPNLSKLVVGKDQISREVLRQFVHSYAPFEIIEIEGM